LLVVRGLTLLNDHALKWLAIGLGKRLVEQGNVSLVLTIGLVGLSLPYVLFSWLAGSLADRHPKPTVIRWCKAAEVLIAAAATAVLGFGAGDSREWLGLPVGLWLLLATVIAIGTQAALMTPSIVGAIPELVPPERLAGANGLFSLVSLVAVLGGTAAGNWVADATPLVQKVRTARPDLLFALPTAVSDAKLLLEKLNEFGLGQGKLPTIGFGIVMAEPDMLKTMDASQLEGLMLAVGSWGAKGHEKLMAELKTRYNEPWMTQNAISTYGDMWVIKEALEHAGKADREAVTVALRKIDGGPSKYYPSGRIKFDDNGRRVDAGLTIIQWQKGVPVTVYPPELAMAAPIWVKK
jgi:hypothetical protein